MENLDQGISRCSVSLRVWCFFFFFFFFVNRLMVYFFGDFGRLILRVSLFMFAHGFLYAISAVEDSIRDFVRKRSWSHAMEKSQFPNGHVPRQRIYSISQLRKAVKWASLLAQLCTVKGDSRTSEAKGTLLFELERNWETALMSFKSVRVVYEQLGKYGDIENQVLCRERVLELDTNINYCSIKDGKSNIKTSELADTGQMEGPAVMDEARSQQEASMTECNWLELEKDLHGSATVPAEKKVVILQEIDDKVEKATKPEVLVRLFDLLIRNTSDLYDLVTSRRDSTPKCFYLAKSYSLAGKRDMIQDLEVLYNNNRSNICIEHAAGIMEEEKAPEKITKGVSSISLAEGGNKAEVFLLKKLDVYESLVADPNTKRVPHIEPFSH
ncbi:hypothetical protein MKW92_010314 [Papaver armeniacum]|nr:hypothetical protein MKW92_010314 [Papaver armeniacum]